MFDIHWLVLCCSLWWLLCSCEALCNLTSPHRHHTYTHTHTQQSWTQLTSSGQRSRSNKDSSTTELRGVVTSDPTTLSSETNTLPKVTSDPRTGLLLNGDHSGTTHPSYGTLISVNSRIVGKGGNVSESQPLIINQSPVSCSKYSYTHVYTHTHTHSHTQSPK